MREEKKKLLEDVMDTETYKVAKEILEKFAPDQLQKSSVSWSQIILWFITNPIKKKMLLKSVVKTKYWFDGVILVRGF